MREIVMEIVRLIIQAVFPVLAGVIVTWAVNLFREHVKNEAVRTAVKAFIDRFEHEEELYEKVIEFVRVKLERWGIKFSKSEIEAITGSVIKDIEEDEKTAPEPLHEATAELEAEPPVNGFDWNTVKYFKESEFNCPSCKNTGTEGMNPNLVKLLDAMREHFGQPITITSGYRCAAYNKKVGGITGSQHTKGNAADFFIRGQSETYTGRIEAIKWAIDYCKQHGLKFRYGYTVDTNGVGLGFYDDGIGKKTTSKSMGRAIHIDCKR